MRHAPIERNKCSLNNGDTKIAIIGFKIGIGIGVLEEEAYLFVGVILNTRATSGPSIVQSVWRREESVSRLSALDGSHHRQQRESYAPLLNNLTKMSVREESTIVRNLSRWL